MVGCRNGGRAAPVVGTHPPFDPGSSARVAPAIWHPDVVPAVVTLAPAPAGFCRGGGLPGSLRPITELREGAARHLVFDLGGARHRVRILDGPDEASLVLAIPLDGRGLGPAKALTGALAGETADDRRSPASRFQRHQLAAMLDIVDAASTGTSLRDIAVATLFPWLELDATEWKSSTERRRIQRLLVAGRHMVAGGYRRLIER